MISNTPKDDVLLPDRHPQQELFVCDVADAVLKDDMASMEHPFFSLAKKPVFAIKKYERNGKFIEIEPSSKGLATIYDKDILIYAISKLIKALNDGERISRKISIQAYDYLVFTNKNTGGKDYEALKKALERLNGTIIRTNINNADFEEAEGFGLIENYKITRSKKGGNRIVGLEITLSDWIFDSINSQKVLTLHPDYFRLRKPLERRIYELARKHCGAQPSWSVSLGTLQQKSGSKSPKDRFKQLIGQIAISNHLPDYELALNDGKAVFTNRSIKQAITKSKTKIFIDADTYNDARQCAPGWDVYVIEDAWRAWMIEGGMDRPEYPAKAYLGFCRSWFKKRGSP